MSVALADLPSNSGAGWANRDKDSLYRRPSAPNPLRDEVEDTMADSGSWNAFAATSEGRRQPAPEPEFGPAPPATSGRTSFGVSAGPISGNWRDGRPTSPAPATPDMPLPMRSARDAASTVPPGETTVPPGRKTTGPSARENTVPPGWETTVPPGRDSAVAPGWDGAVPPGWSATEPVQAERPSDADAWFGQKRPPASITAESVLDRSRRPLPSPSREPAPGPARRPLSHVAGGADDGIGDILNGPGHEIRQHRAPRHPAAPVSPAGMPAEPRRGRGVMVAGAVLTVAVLMGATVAGVTYFSGPDKDLTSVLELGAGRGDKRTVSAPLDGRTAAAFELVSAVTRVTVRSEDLGNDLYRMTTGPGSGVLPEPAVTQDSVRLQLTPGGDGDTGEVEVVLSAEVTWTLRFSGAADEQILNLQGGKVAGIDVAGGARRTAIQLPEAAGTVPLKVTGAVDELAMTSPAGNPVRVQLKGGAKTVAAGTRTLRDVPPGSTVTPKDWATNDRYDVEAEARVTLLSIDTAK
ncbi:hypothetical protein AB0J80_18950 [Actinoplanes sp. NPDC049548]|uniref:hypothetical protein n=1 Tax=Actinoplanes sp. NPDC049548 TaxID=3155152 RepID=UPI0034353846